jgi:hypothetical protein
MGTLLSGGAIAVPMAAHPAAAKTFADTADYCAGLLPLWVGADNWTMGTTSIGVGQRLGFGKAGATSANRSSEVALGSRPTHEG